MSECFGKGHRGCATFGGPTFGSVDDFGFAAKEVALELLEVGEQPLFGVHRPSLIVRDFAENGAIANDLLPLLHLNGAEPAELGPPDIVVAGAGRVVQTVAETQVLADENNGIASEMLGKVEREMRHSRASAREFHLAYRQFAKHRFGEPIAQQGNRPGVHAQDRTRGLGLGDKLRIDSFGKLLEKLRADFVVIEAGHVMGLDSHVEQRLKNRLHRNQNRVA